MARAMECHLSGANEQSAWLWHSSTFGLSSSWHQPLLISSLDSNLCQQTTIFNALYYFLLWRENWWWRKSFNVVWNSNFGLQPRSVVISHELQSFEKQNKKLKYILCKFRIEKCMEERKLTQCNGSKDGRDPEKRDQTPDAGLLLPSPWLLHQSYIKPKHWFVYLRSYIRHLIAWARCWHRDSSK